MWTYDQSSGQLWHDGNIAGTGYAGNGEGKNNPAMQHVHDVGPLPRGVYTIGQPHDTPNHGPFVLDLTPDPTNEMHGRGGFLIHGDSIRAPGTASQGCIILARAVRERIAASDDKRLEVVDFFAPPQASRST